MRLPDNPPLPSGSDLRALTVQVQTLMRQVAQQVNGLTDGRMSAFTTAMPSVPTTGTWSAGDKVKNSNVAVLGPDGAKYVVDGWLCVVGGEPGTWVELQLPVALPPSAPPSPTPAPAPSAPYSSRVQGENMTGATALNGSQIAALGIPSGYDGTGLADEDTSAGNVKTASFAGVPAGTFTLNVGFFAWGAQQNSIQIDSGTATSYMFTPPTGGGYGVLTISGISLTAGTHTVSFVSDWGYVYPDYVELVQGVSAPAPAPSPAPAPAPAPGSGPFYPIGSRLDGAYPHGISVTGYTNAQKDALVKSCYDAWKNNRLKAAPPFTPSSGIYAGQTITDGYLVDAPEKILDATSSSPAVYSATVSEAIGYGMLIVVAMAHTDSTKGEANAQAIFNGLFKVWRGNPAYAMTSTNGANKYLMDWRIGTRDSSTAPIGDLSTQGGGYNAGDGDMDAALACLMAHRQWGSTGTINYYQEALNTIGALKVADFASNGVMYVPPLGQNHDCSRTSDYMPGHFRSFKKATNDTFWDDARTNSLALINTIVSGFAATTHLTPGWIYQPLSSRPVPSPGGKIESTIEGDYDQNAVRNPWRWGTDYLFSGDTGWQAVAGNITAFIKSDSGADPAQTSWAYTLDGAILSPTRYYEPTTTGCVMVGAMVDSAHQAFLNACFTQNTGHFNSNYFAAELTLLPLIVASGNWWLP